MHLCDGHTTDDYLVHTTSTFAFEAEKLTMIQQITQADKVTCQEFCAELLDQIGNEKTDIIFNDDC